MYRLHDLDFDRLQIGVIALILPNTTLRAPNGEILLHRQILHRAAQPSILILEDGVHYLLFHNIIMESVIPPS